MLKILKYLPKNLWPLILLSLVLIVVQVWLDLKIPGYMEEITDLVQTPGSSVGEVLGVGGWMLLCAFGSLAAAIVTGYFAARIAASFAGRLRELQFNKVQSFSMEELGRFTISSLITRSTNDVTQLQMIIAMGLQAIIKAPIMAVWAILKIAGKSWQWTGATALAVLLIIVAIIIVMVLVVPKFKVIQRLTDKLNGVMRENLTGIRVVRAYNAEDYQEEKFEEVNAELTNTNLFTQKVMALMQPVMGLVNNGLVLAVYWIGAIIISNTMGPDRMGIFSDMVVFSSYAMQVVMAFMMMSMIFVMVPRAQVSANRVNEVLDTEPSIIDGNKTEGMPGVKGRVEFKNVSFKYPGAADYVLENINFTAESGQTVAFIGSTGSGKSTIINLVPRFYDATNGQVLVDGVDVKKYKAEVLHDKLGYVPQKAILFSGTVESNVAYGENGQDKITLEQVKQAVAVAQGKDFVENMEGGYEAEISRSGTNISGGQRQRLSIARAIARNPEIYLFDDSFSALDFKTDRALRSALKKATGDATSIIVAQRIGTIMDADQIFVLDEGKIAGHGTHKELLKDCEIYREIAYSQLSAKELE